ncbi:MAG: type IV pilus twitching motility protein PilT [Clostridium sp.]|nr:type IV pilus twitching motility protein PilT [Clostridium sp.]
MAEAYFSSIEALLQEANLQEATDVHFNAGFPVTFRIFGKLIPFGEIMDAEEVRRMLQQLLTPGQQRALEERRSVDCAVSFKGVGRYRVHVYYQRGALSGAIRKLADEIPGLSALGLPPAVTGLANLKMGLVLVTGATGSGKSTTLASLVDLINNTIEHNIITVEDPIEYVHYSKKSLVSQREIHTDVPSFPDALRGALRADPDIILVGEMRDLETIRTAILAAETGHLVLSTLHSRDASSTINRILGAFPPEEQQQIRQQLSVSLKAVISQQLLPRADGCGRVLACELMLVTPAIANLIRLGKADHIYMAIETGMRLGMRTMEQSLTELYQSGKISMETALRSARSAELIQHRLKSGGTGKERAKIIEPQAFNQK